jgi:hypothetical protein
MPSGVMFVTRGCKNSLFSVFDFLSNLDCGQWYKFWIWVAICRRKWPTIQQKNEWTQKWLYEKDALARESTLCVAGALIGRLWQIQKIISLTTIQVGKIIKDRKKRVLDPRVTNITPERHTQKGQIFCFLTF